MAGGSYLLLERNDDSLALRLLGLMVFEGTMLWAVIMYQGSGGQWLFFLVMLAPLAPMSGLQLSDVRRYWLMETEDIDEAG